MYFIKKLFKFVFKAVRTHAGKGMRRNIIHLDLYSFCSHVKSGIVVRSLLVRIKAGFLHTISEITFIRWLYKKVTDYMLNSAPGLGCNIYDET